MVNIRVYFNSQRLTVNNFSLSKKDHWIPFFHSHQVVSEGLIHKIDIHLRWRFQMGIIVHEVI